MQHCAQFAKAGLQALLAVDLSSGRLLLAARATESNQFAVVFSSSDAPFVFRPAYPSATRGPLRRRSTLLRTNMLDQCRYCWQRWCVGVT
jgi:hypothetical protein